MLIQEVNMPSKATPKPNSSTPTHQDFHWIHGDGRSNPLANFVELTQDIVAGLHTCLQIYYTSRLQRDINLDAEPGQEAAPALGMFDADHLLRLSIASSALLSEEAARRIEALNLPLRESCS
jgi:hypothetical protein